MNDILAKLVEAREALEDWENAAAHVEADHPDERHCGCVPVLRKLLTDARQELSEERESIVGWENKWRCAIEIAARAEVERDEAREEAINKTESIQIAANRIDELKNRSEHWCDMHTIATKERDEARELCRELNDLVAYGLGQSGDEWSLEAMRQAADAIQKAKSLEESK
jgi:hypothetical protein